MSVFKNESGEVVTLPGVDGIPFRGRAVPNIKAEELQNLKPTLDAKILFLDLSKPEDLAKYQKAWDEIAKGLAVCGREEVMALPESRTFLVMLRYAHQFVEPPNYQSQRGRYEHGQWIFDGPHGDPSGEARG